MRAERDPTSRPRGNDQTANAVYSLDSQGGGRSEMSNQATATDAATVAATMHVNRSGIRIPLRCPFLHPGRKARPSMMQLRPSSMPDAFAAKVDSAGALIWNTFLGGGDFDTGGGIAVDDSERVGANEEATRLPR